MSLNGFNGFLARYVAQNEASEVAFGLAGLPNYDSYLPPSGLPLHITTTTATPDIQRVKSTVQSTGRPAAVLVCHGQPSIFVAGSRIGAVWLLRELLPEDASLSDDVWSQLAGVAWRADHNISREEERAGATEDLSEKNLEQEGEQEAEKEEEKRGEQEGEQEAEEEEEERGEQEGEQEAEKEGEGRGKQEGEQEAEKEGEGRGEQEGEQEGEEEGEEEGNKEEQPPLDTQRHGQDDLIPTVGPNKTITAGRIRKRKAKTGAQGRAPKKAKSDADAGQNKTPEDWQIPPPTQAAGYKEFRAWERLSSLPPQMREMIIQVKQNLEGGSIQWRERPAPRKRGRPSKSKKDSKIMSYSDAESWFIRAKAISEQKTLEQAVAVLATQDLAPPTADSARSPTLNGQGAPSTPWRQQQQQQQQQSLPPSGQGSPVPDSSPSAPPDEGQQLQLYQPQQQDPGQQSSSLVLVQGGVEQLVTAASRLRSSTQGVALAAVRNRLHKAHFSLVYEQTIATILQQRRETRSKQLTGSAGHARTVAWQQLREELADRPKQLQLLEAISPVAVSRWRRFFECLGYGTVFLISPEDLPNSFIEKDLNNDEFAQFLLLAKRMNPRAVKLGAAIWDAVDGPAALQNGDFSFSGVNVDVLQAASLLIDGLSQGTIMGEVEDGEKSEKGIDRL